MFFKRFLYMVEKFSGMSLIKHFTWFRPKSGDFHNAAIKDVIINMHILRY